MYNFLPLTIKQCEDVRARLKEIYLEYNTIFLIMLIDILISLFGCVFAFSAPCTLFLLFLYFMILYSLLGILYSL